MMQPPESLGAIIGLFLFLSLAALLAIAALRAPGRRNRAPAAPDDLQARPCPAVKEAQKRLADMQPRPVVDFPDVVAVTHPFLDPDFIDDAPLIDEGPCCRVCGCTDCYACPGGCYWVAPDLCSRCAERQVPPT